MVQCQAQAMLLSGGQGYARDTKKLAFQAKGPVGQNQGGARVTQNDCISNPHSKEWQTSRTGSQRGPRSAQQTEAKNQG